MAVLSRQAVEEIIISARKEAASRHAPFIRLAKFCTEKQLQNAIRSYAFGAREKDVIAITIDDILQSGKKGMLFTATGLWGHDLDHNTEKYYSREACPQQPIRFSALREAQAMNGMRIRLIYQNGDVKILYGSVYTEFLLCVLGKIIAALRSRNTENISPSPASAAASAPSSAPEPVPAAAAKKDAGKPAAKQEPVKKERVERKPCLTVGTIGHKEQGKTTLTAAITAVLAGRYQRNKAVTPAEIDNTAEERARKGSIHVKAVEYESDKYRFAHLDCPGSHRFADSTAAAVSMMDCAILVTDAVYGVMAQTVEHLLFAREAGVPQIVVFLNKCDTLEDAGFLGILESELTETLKEYGYDGCPIIMGSALKALEDPEGVWGDKILDLIYEIQRVAPGPKRKDGEPFLMPVLRAYEKPGLGTVAFGRVERGVLRKGDAADILGLKKGSLKAEIESLEFFGRKLDEAGTGDCIGVLLKGVPENTVKVGAFLAAPGSIGLNKRISAQTVLLTRHEGGRHTAIHDGFRAQFLFSTANVTGTFRFSSSDEKHEPGDHMETGIEFDYPTVCTPGRNFLIRESGDTIGYGKVTALKE